MRSSATHYYASRPPGGSNRFTITYELKRGPGGQSGGMNYTGAMGGGNTTIEFVSDSGVFSKDRVDFGSDLLIRSAPPLSGKVLDLGCGYGAVGISLAILNPGAEFWFSDVNERAVGLCRENYARLVAKNRPGGNAANIVCSDGFDNLGEGGFDAIVTNPPIRTGKMNIYRLYEEAFGRLNPGGSFIVVIQKKQGMASTYGKLESLFGNCSDIARRAGYHVLVSIKSI